MIDAKKGHSHVQEMSFNLLHVMEKGLIVLLA